VLKGKVEEQKSCCCFWL